METELKFKIPANSRSHLEGIFASKQLRGAVGVERREVTTYFDTSKFALARAGFSLRVRHAGGANIQTLKSISSVSGAAAQRFEKEWPLDGKKPDLERLVGTPVFALVGTTDIPGLEAVFVTDVQRTTYPISLGNGATAECAIDEGEIRAGTVHAPVRELEIELKDGSLAALYVFARKLHALCPLEIASESKSSRGYRLITGLPPGASKAGKVKLARKVTLEGGLRTIIGSGVGQLLSNLPALGLADDAEALHQARVAIERLRSAFRLFEQYLETDAAHVFMRKLKHFGGIFGVARDLDVFVLETIPNARKEGVAGDWLDRLLGRAKEARLEAHRAVESLVAAPKFTGLVLALSTWIENGCWPAAVKHRGKLRATMLSKIAPNILGPVEAKTCRLGHRIERRFENRLHKVRKMLKTLRDGVEDLGTLYGAKETKRYCLACEAVQSVLGAVNDAIAADALVAKLSFGDDAGLVPGIDLFSEWTSRRRDAAMARLPEAWAGFRREKAFWH